jgi:hypothetical protein
MPVRVTPEMAQSKWLTGIGNAGERMKAGALAVQEAPGRLAAAQADKWLIRLQQSKDKFIRNVSRVSKEDWQNAYVNYGIARAQQGAQQKKQKYADAMADFFPYLGQGMDRIKSMPSTTLEEKIARSAAMIRWSAQYKRGATK